MTIGHFIPQSSKWRNATQHHLGYTAHNFRFVPFPATVSACAAHQSTSRLGALPAIEPEPALAEAIAAAADGGGETVYAVGQFAIAVGDPEIVTPIVAVNIASNDVLTFDRLVMLSDGTRYVSGVRFDSVSRMRPGKEAAAIAAGIDPCCHVLRFKTGATGHSDEQQHRGVHPARPRTGTASAPRAPVIYDSSY